MSAYYETVLADSPSLWWRLNETTGSTATDSSGSGFNGTYEIGTTLGGAPLAFGPGYSAVFDGTSNDDVHLSNAATCAFSSGTVEAWIKTTSPGGGFCAIVAKTNAYSLFLNNSVLISYDWGGGAERSTGVNLADGLIHHVALVFDSGVSNGTVIYLDGVAVLTTTMTVSNQATSVYVAASGGAQQINATIDEVAIYSTKLSATQILAHYTAGKPPSGMSYHDLVLTGGPSLYYRLGAGGTADQSGNNYTGTPTSGVTVGGAAGPLGEGVAATDFDGTGWITSDYKPFANGITLTFEGWFIKDALGSFAQLWAHHLVYYTQLTINNTDQIYLSMDAGGTTRAFSSYTITAGKWTYYAVVVNEPSDTTDLYINGAFVQQLAPTEPWSTAGSAGISVSGAAAPLDGKMAEFAVYERGLSAAEILAHYRAGTAEAEVIWVPTAARMR